MKGSHPHRGSARVTALLLLFALLAAAAPLSPARAETEFTQIEIPDWFQPMSAEDMKPFPDGADVVSGPPALTDIGRERLARENGGSAILSAAPAAPGAPALSVTPGAGSLPKVVDNSALKYFPPIGDQGATPLCGYFTQYYYCYTYMTAMYRDTDVKAEGDRAIFSPNFTYEAGLQGQGSLYDPSRYHPYVPYESIAYIGAVTLDLWPISGKILDLRNDAAASVSRELWYAALSNKAADRTLVIPKDDDRYGGMGVVRPNPQYKEHLKQHLFNGYIFEFTTEVNGWFGTRIKDNPHSAADDAAVGEWIYSYRPDRGGAHAMTVVGFHDDLWFDKNSNGRIDQGELGAFKIANSWGTGFGNDGFLWLPYSEADAAFRWWFETYVPRETPHKPRLLAEFTVSAPNVDTDFYVALSWGAKGEGKEEFCSMPHGGRLGASPSLFIVDLTDMLDQHGLDLEWDEYDFYFYVWPGSDPLEIHDFKLTDGNGAVLKAYDDMPIEFTASYGNYSDGSLYTAYTTDLKMTYGRTAVPNGHWRVKWNASGGAPVPPSVVPDGGVIDAPPDAARDGYAVKGWYLDSARTRPAEFPLTVTGDMTLYAKWLRHYADYSGDSTYLVPDEDGSGRYIDLSTETFIFTQPFEIAAYSVDGGTKWKPGVPQLPVVLNKMSRLALTDNYDGKAKKPAEGAAVVQFPIIQDRPRANPDKLVANYALLADGTGATPGAWTLSRKDGTVKSFRNVPYIQELQIAESSNKKTPDGEWRNFPEEGVPVLPNGSPKRTYLLRTLPVVDHEGEAFPVPASKTFKLTPQVQQKPTKLKADYKKEVIKVKAGGMIFGGDMAALQLARSDPQWADSAPLFAPGLMYQATAADKKNGVSLTAVLDATESGVQTICLWTPATEKKPASIPQEYKLAVRAAAPSQTIDGVNGKVTLPKTLEIFNGSKWGSLPKFTATTTLENAVRIKAAARASGVDDSAQFAASKAVGLTVDVGLYSGTKSGVLRAVIGLGGM